MPRIDISVTYNKLFIDLSVKLVQQKKRNHGAKRQKAIKEEVAKLLQVGFIRDFLHTTWLANAILVKKSNRRWWIYVDFTNLNKACPKDSYLLSDE